MASVLAHRGPDGWGFYIGPRRNVSLINLRLAIVDIPNGNQPMSNESGTVWVTLNGEIYGFAAIRHDLEARGHTFRTKSDTEVIVHLYEEYGEGFVRRLRGEFAFALYDERISTLYLYRDRFGIKPLYYASTARTLAFASEAKGLLRHPSFRAELQPEALYRTLCSVLLPTETIFKGIHQVDPGTYLKVTNGAVETRRYWSLPIGDGERETSRTPRQQNEDVHQFHERFSEAVELRRHGDVPVGVYLSGGVDSTAAATVLSHLGPTKPTAFTIAFDHPQYDELEAASEVAMREGLDHRVVCVRKGDLARHFTTSLWHSEIPVINTHGTAKFLLSKLAQSEVKVVVTGEGADELLEGYRLFTHLALLEESKSSARHIRARYRLWRFRRHEGNVAGLTQIDHFVDYQRVVDLFGAYPYQALRVLLHAQKLPAVLGHDFQASVRGIDPLEDLATLVGPDVKYALSSRKLTQLLLFRTQLPNYLLNYLGDRQEMAHSVEARLPFLDHKLVEFVMGRCPNYKDKKLLRLMLGRLVGSETAALPKKMFLAPSLDTLIPASGDNPIDQYLKDEVVRQVGVFDPRKLNAINSAIRFLPKHSYQYTVSEALLIGAASIHIINELFCRQFQRRAEEAIRASCWTRISRTPVVSACPDSATLLETLQGKSGEVGSR